MIHGIFLVVILKKALTLQGKSGKVNKTNAMTKTSTRIHPFFRELPVGERQQKDCAEFLSERLC